MTSGPTSPDDLMHEKAVYEKYGNLFAERELLEARRLGQIEWYDLRKGPHYTDQQIVAYLNSKVKTRCENRPLDPELPVPAADAVRRPASFKSAISGSGPKQTAASSTLIGMTPKLEELAARQLDSDVNN